MWFLISHLWKIKVMTKNKTNKYWLTSKEAIKIAKIKNCDLMHHRLAGRLKFEKRGNSFFYSKDSVEKLRNRKNSIKPST